MRKSLKFAAVLFVACATAFGAFAQESRECKNAIGASYSYIMPITFTGGIQYQRWITDTTAIAVEAGGFSYDNFACYSVGAEVDFSLFRAEYSVADGSIPFFSSTEMFLYVKGNHMGTFIPEEYVAYGTIGAGFGMDIGMLQHVSYILTIGYNGTYNNAQGLGSGVAFGCGIRYVF